VTDRSDWMPQFDNALSVVDAAIEVEQSKLVDEANAVERDRARLAMQVLLDGRQILATRVFDMLDCATSLHDGDAAQHALRFVERLAASSSAEEARALMRELLPRSLESIVGPWPPR